MRRLYNLDLFRIGLALLVYAFHSLSHLGCSFGFFNSFVGLGAISMTAFFVLSGFTLCGKYQNMQLDWRNIRFFFKKKITKSFAYLLYLCNCLCDI